MSDEKSKQINWIKHVPSWALAGVVSAIIMFGGYKVTINNLENDVSMLKSESKVINERLVSNESGYKSDMSWIKESLVRIERKVDTTRR